MTLREELALQGRWLFRWRSYLPLLIVPILLIASQDSEYLESLLGDTIEDCYEYLCIALSFLGLIVRCLTVGYVPKGTSGRSTKRQKAESLNTTGMYSITRNPLYLGNFFIILGISMFTQIWWAVLIVALLFWIYYERIIFAEEEFLKEKFGDLYVNWAKITPAFWPKFNHYHTPLLPFSFKNVLKREYTGFFVIISSFTFLEIVGDLWAEGRLELDLSWVIFFAVGLIVYLTLRTLKKKTMILHVNGR